MKYILFYEEAGKLSGKYPHNRVQVDQWCAMVGLEHLIIDKSKNMRKTNGNVFYSIEEAIAAFPDYEFVFMDRYAKTKHTEFIHPKDNVIYCVGSDDDGFQGLDLTPYKTLTLDNVRTVEESDYYASILVPMLLADIYLRRS